MLEFLHAKKNNQTITISHSERAFISALLITKMALVGAWRAPTKKVLRNNIGQAQDDIE